MEYLEIDLLHQKGYINAIDRAFADMLDRRLGGIDPWVLLAAVLVSRAATTGDVCLDLAALTQEGFRPDDSPQTIAVEISLEQWIERLSKSPAVGTMGDKKPLILNDFRLYLQRYWQYENMVAQGLHELCGQIEDTAGIPAASASCLCELISNDDEDQQRAVLTAMKNRFTVISGGPGTGKTFTIAQIILCLHQIYGTGTLRIKLAGPTGKAAARLQEALDQAFQTLEENGHGIPAGVSPAQTIHRLLGVTPGRTRFLYNANHRLPADVVIVDEASMIDLALMAKLIQAVPASARLILVGDKDQLASVEAGAVLGDICAGLPAYAIKKRRSAGNNHQALAAKRHGSDFGAHIVALKKNYRFDPNSGIDALGAAVNAGDVDRSLALLDSGGRRDIVLRPYDSRKEIEAALEQLAIEKIAPVFSIRDARMALKHLGTFKILTPLRQGPMGVQTLNQRVEQLLVRHNLIEPSRMTAPDWYPGRPVMITHNDYYHNLFNGDVGIAMAAPTDSFPRLQVFFPDQKQGLKSLAPEQLPAHETVYVMTVHKSQGTEFDCVILILPDRDVPILTRELLYTAITRARRRVEIWGRTDLLKKAIPRRIRRVSGLKDFLWPQSQFEFE